MWAEQKQQNKPMQALFGQARPALAHTDPDFVDIKTRLIYGEVYEQVSLDPGMRELLILTVGIVNQTIKEVALHTSAALHVGATPAQIKEAAYHCAPYIGVGKAEAALTAINDVLAERGISLPLPSASTTDEQTRLEAGIAAQKAIFGAHIDAMRAAAPDDQKHLQDHLSAWCFGDTCTRAGLDAAQRELLTFCILCAQGGCENQLRSHINGNVAVGNDKNVLIDALTVCMPYVGFPRTLNALACLNEILP